MREDTKGWLLNEAGYDLRALGRLSDATQPMLASLDLLIAQKNWKQSAIAASNLSELYLTIGDVVQALAYAKQSVELADRGNDAFWRMQNRTKVADAQHQAGSLAEAETTFREVEEIQKKDQPEFSFLYSTPGFYYCDLLISQGNYADVQRRANRTIEIAKRNNWLLDIALEYLSLGRAHLLQSQHEPNHPFTESANYLNRAVDGLRESGNQDEVPRGLLARAEFHRVTGALDKAKRDLDEAFSIATRGGMGLFVADCHLEYARLAAVRGGWRRCAAVRGGARRCAAVRGGARRCAAVRGGARRCAAVRGGRGEPPARPYNDDAREHLAIAKKMIAEMGYQRRDKEVEALEHEIRELTARQ